MCDDPPGFGRDVLGALRKPLEEGSVSVVRIGRPNRGGPSSRRGGMLRECVSLKAVPDRPAEREMLQPGTRRDDPRVKSWRAVLPGVSGWPQAISRLMSPDPL